MVELMVGYAAICIMSTFLSVYLRRNRFIAFTGDRGAARKAILPAFEPLLQIVATITGVYVVFFIAVLSTKYYNLIDYFDMKLFTSGRQFVSLLVIFFMFQKSVSIPALRRACTYTILVTCQTVATIYLLVRYDASLNAQRYYATLEDACFVVLYAYVYLRPPERATQRSLREYCLYSLVSLFFGIMHSYYFHVKHYEMGMKLVLANAIWVAFCPLFIWRILRADTEHWRGLGQRAVELQLILRQKRSMPEHISSGGLHLLIEMHRRNIIDFAHLQILNLIGRGATADVFRGKLHSRTTVAVKVYTPIEMNEETVAGYSHEAALCASLRHPNIVAFYGMCVCPPNICLISELCLGSLEDVIVALAHKTKETRSRRQLEINLAYMLDAARAIAYLHSFSPPFIHRDIKTGNFLVDDRGVVKLTDFGESRSLPKHQATDEVRISISQRTSYKQSCMSVCGTVDYMPPEIINGRGGKASYGASADVYSLGITMWKILHPLNDIYPSNGSHLKVYEWVLAGKRPEFSLNVPPKLKKLIEACWDANTTMRPSAQNVVHNLEEIQEELLASLAENLVSSMGAYGKHTVKGKSHHSVFPGDKATTYLLESNLVENSGESDRLGNALMDAGYIHHVKHNHAFEDSAILYYLAERCIYDYHPAKHDDLDSSFLGSDATVPPNRRDQSSFTFTARDYHSSIFFSSRTSPSKRTSSAFGSKICSCRRVAQGFKPRPRGHRIKSDRLTQRRYPSLLRSTNLTTKLLLPEKGDTLMEVDDFSDFDMLATHASHLDRTTTA